MPNTITSSSWAKILPPNSMKWPPKNRKRNLRTTFFGFLKKSFEVQPAHPKNGRKRRWICRRERVEGSYQFYAEAVGRYPRLSVTVGWWIRSDTWITTLRERGSTTRTTRSWMESWSGPTTERWCMDIPPARDRRSRPSTRRWSPGTNDDGAWPITIPMVLSIEPNTVASCTPRTASTCGISSSL